ncbi:MAG TPA: hypothetical protein VFF82_11145 [Rhodocyclaceae bacterium]|nr:hypothetical protein [Rhodocyclaceae bacterium]
MSGAAPRLILFHKQKTSARTRFLRFPDTVLARGPLTVAEERMALPAGSLEVVADFRMDVDTVDGVVPVLLAGFTSIDPPFAAAEAIGGRFVAITEARGLPPVELALLRNAYEVLIG